MLIWIGGMDVGGATIQGFDSLVSCQNAIPTVAANFPNPWGYMAPEVKCVELSK